MRVITGTARGKRLATLEGNDVRPTTDRVKEAMFSMIQFEVEGGNILDLYCGSGQLGIEALSRGGRFCTFVDNHKSSQKVTGENLVTVGMVDRSKIVGQDAVTFAKSVNDSFDIVVMDPPYNSQTTPELLVAISNKMNSSGVIICESSKEEVMPAVLENEYLLYKSYRYGSIKLTVYRQEEA